MLIYCTYSARYLSDGLRMAFPTTEEADNNNGDCNCISWDFKQKQVGFNSIIFILFD